MPLPAGSKAPDFILKTKTADGLKDVRLGDHLGRQSVVLLFFPLAFTGVCTQEMCDVTSGLNAYAGKGAAVYGISVDSPYAHEAWAKAHAIKVTLLSDLGRSVARAYGVIMPHPIGGETSARAAFVIGKDGVIKYAEQTATPKELPSFDKINAALAGA